MTNGYPPGPSPYGPDRPGVPARSSGGHPLGWIALVVLLLMTGVTAVATWVRADGHTHSSAIQVPGPGGGTGVAPQGGRLSAAPTPSSYPTLPSYTPTTYSSPPVPTPTYLLDPTAVSRTLDGFLNAMTYHDLATTKSLVCPKYRADYRGTYFNGNEIAHWHRSAFDIIPDQNWIAIYVAIDLRNPSTGHSAGTYNHNWIVEKDDNVYYVCGYQV